MEYYDDYLQHYGVKGMKWGKHKLAAKIYDVNAKFYGKRKGGMNKMLAQANASAAKRENLIAENIRTGNTTATKSTATTNRVIKDYQNMSNKQFAGKYKTSKKTYAKRVQKYGDPYLYRTQGKKLVGEALEKNRQAVKNIRNSPSVDRGMDAVNTLLEQQRVTD